MHSHMFRIILVKYQSDTMAFCACTSCMHLAWFNKIKFLLKNFECLAGGLKIAMWKVLFLNKKSFTNETGGDELIYRKISQKCYKWMQLVSCKQKTSYNDIAQSWLSICKNENCNLRWEWVVVTLWLS